MKPRVTRHAPFLFTALLGWALCGPAAAADLEQATKLLRSGEYGAAAQAFQGAVKRAGAAAWLGLARAQLERGQLAEAQRSARRAAVGKSWAAAMTLVGEAQLRGGQRAAAEGTLKGVLARERKHHRALMLLALSYRERGQLALAKAIFEEFYDDYDAEKIDKKSAEQLTYVAMACRYTGNFRDANDVLADARRVDPTHVETFVQWGEISLEKYEAGHAEQHYEAALKLNPHHVRALLGLARVKLEQSNDVAAALALIERAGRVDAQNLDAQVLRARVLIDNEEHAQAEALLNAALARNGAHLDALTLLAASHFLRDDLAGFARLKGRVLALNPRFVAFYHAVVDLAVRHHRYADSIALGREAIALDPDDPYALADLGMNYLRLGDEAQGLQHLRRAWERDKYNVRNFNQLELFEKTLASEYEFIHTKSFKLRVHKDEKQLLARIVPPVLEEALATYAKKYRFTPARPIVVELFRDPEHYAIRTVGLRGLAAIAVCFGPVITASSPLRGRFNWGQVLWHELNHVFTIQLSRSRVPRWLTEGFAELEPVLVQPQWKRENDLDLYQALRAGKLRGLAAMNAAFTRARSIDEMVVAYHQGSRIAAHLVERFGLPRVLEAVKLYGRGKGTAEILPRITGLSLEQLDERFRAGELARLAHYNRSWLLDLGDYADLDARRLRAEAAPDDLVAQGAYAAALFVAGKHEAAEQRVAEVLRKAPADRTALLLSARLALLRRQPAQAEQRLRALIAAGGDGYTARLALGELALGRKDLKAAEQQLVQASRLDPERSQPLLMLYRLHERRGAADRALDALKRFVLLEQQAFAPALKLVELLAKRGDHAGVRRYGELAYYVDPASVRLHTLLADAHAAAAPQRDLRRAIWHLETALLVKPEDKGALAELHVRLCRVHLLGGDKRRARQHFDKARLADPDRPELVELRKRL